jgi:hypothetical protein
MDAPQDGGRVLLRVAELDGTFVRDIPLPAMSTLGGNQLHHELIDSRPDSDILLRVETSAGHSSAGKPTAKAIAEAADRLVFLEGTLGCTPL